MRHRVRRIGDRSRGNSDGGSRRRQTKRRQRSAVVEGERIDAGADPAAPARCLDAQRTRPFAWLRAALE